MDAVEYFKIKGRMCAAHEDVCDDCPLAIDCFSKELENPEEAVKIVNEWNESHPRRTRQDAFLEVYPDAKTFQGAYAEPVILIKPCSLIKNYASEHWCEKWDCMSCRQLYWWKPLPEKKMKKLDSTEKQLPARPKGKWIRNDNGTYSCSLCHSWLPEEQYHYAQFCLHCGAEMKGDRNAIN